MADEIARLRALLEAAEKRFADAEKVIKKEQRRRKEEEERNKKSRPQALPQYLEACHLLSLAIEVVTKKSLTTQGDTTNPTGRIYPLRIIPWDNYSTQQKDIWDRLFCGTVENAVQKLVDKVYNDEQLRVRLGILGSATFESYTNLGDSVDAVSRSVEQMTMAENVGADTITPAPKRARRRAGRGKKGPADQFCIYKRSNGRNVPALAIEYKAPHKLTKDEVVAVDKGVQYSYVCTGETFVFLRIPDSPSVVYYSVCVLNLDIVEDDKNRLHCTAVAQVFMFVLLALRLPPPPLTWHDYADSLDTWAVEFEDVLRDIPETERKAPRESPYVPQRWKGFTRSPIKTRSRCRPESSGTYSQNKDESEEKDSLPSPSASQSLRSSKKAPGSAGAAASAPCAPRTFRALGPWNGSLVYNMGRNNPVGFSEDNAVEDVLRMLLRIIP
ncbi:hypothetical protein F5B18DRAFT_667149 [Nemania serpens]|nr:hypothetical protein F5B18DRAFT_667149 [Nemania serpens]